MRNVMEESSGQLDSHTAEVYRTAATVKGGRRFSFGALVIVGDRRGKVGYGYAKSNEVPNAIDKAQQRAKRELTMVPMLGNTIPHGVEGRYGASRVRLIPASPGTGVVAGGTVRAVLEHAGITDCLTKCFGSTTTMNVVKAVFDGLSQLRTAEHVAELRGVDLGKTETELKVEAGKRFLPAEGTVKPAEKIVIEPTKKPEAPKTEAEKPAEPEVSADADGENKNDDASA